METGFHEPLRHPDPAFPVIFHPNALEGAGRVEAHWHEGIEVLCCFQGAAAVRSGGEQLLMQAGELAVVNSGDLHSIEPQEPPCRYYCLIVEPALFAETDFPFRTGILRRHISDPETAGLFSQINREMEQRESCYKEAVKGCIFLLFSRLYRRYRLSAAAEDPLTGQHQAAVKKAIVYLRAHFQEKLLLEDVCGAVGFSKFYFCRQFRQVTGRSIGEYLQYLRCANARRLLESGEYNIGESARLSGFSEMSYFTRVFKKQTGLLPSQVRKRK